MTDEQIADHFARTCGLTYPALYEAFLQAIKEKEKQMTSSIVTMNKPQYVVTSTQYQNNNEQKPEISTR